MAEFVTFESLAEGDYFVARGGKFFVKETLNLFSQTPDVPGKAQNAFGIANRTGSWAHFDGPTLAQRYDIDIHGRPADVVLLKERQKA